MLAQVAQSVWRFLNVNVLVCERGRWSGFEGQCVASEEAMWEARSRHVKILLREMSKSDKFPERVRESERERQGDCGFGFVFVFGKCLRGSVRSSVGTRNVGIEYPSVGTRNVIR